YYQGEPVYLYYFGIFFFFYDYEICMLLAAPIYFREDMDIEEPADGVNFHSGKNNQTEGPILLEYAEDVTKTGIGLMNIEQQRTAKTIGEIHPHNNLQRRDTPFLPFLP
ncbi:hypothetical protein STEG23_027416, partial [Scotinomys teguina]